MGFRGFSGNVNRDGGAGEKFHGHFIAGAITAFFQDTDHLIADLRGVAESLNFTRIILSAQSDRGGIGGNHFAAKFQLLCLGV